MKSLQQDYNSFLCSTLLVLSSAEFLMGDDRNHLQAPCGHSSPKEILQVPKMDLGQGLPEQNHLIARASSTALALNLLHKYLLLL